MSSSSRVLIVYGPSEADGTSKIFFFKYPDEFGFSVSRTFDYIRRRYPRQRLQDILGDTSTEVHAFAAKLMRLEHP